MRLIFILRTISDVVANKLILTGQDNTIERVSGSNSIVDEIIYLKPM